MGEEVKEAQKLGKTITLELLSDRNSELRNLEQCKALSS